MVSSFDQVFVVFGPTASGKSDLGIFLSELKNGEIINADSVQIYDALPNLTAQPSKKDMEKIPHHLYGILSPEENNSVGTWLSLVDKEIKNVIANGKTPVVIGGTGMYVSALLNGINHIPEIEKSIRDNAKNLFSELGIAGFYEELISLDQKVIGIISPKDSQRMIRAYEVKKATGISITDWWKNPDRKHIKYNFYKIFVNPPREDLYAKCDARFIKMIDNNVIDEVISLKRKYKNLEKLGIYKAIGVKEILSMLNKEITVNEMIAKAQQSTRNYAKRQITWFKNQINSDAIIDTSDKQEQKNMLKTYLNKLV